MPQGINEKVPYPKKFHKFQLYHPKRNEALMKKVTYPKIPKVPNVGYTRRQSMEKFRILKNLYIPNNTKLLTMFFSISMFYVIFVSV